MLSILDHTRGLPTALPPGQIPEAEFATLRDWMRGEQCLAAISHRRLGRQAGLQEGEVSRLLDKWYRQVQVSLTGDKRGPFCLEVSNQVPAPALISPTVCVLDTNRRPDTSALK